MHVWTIIKHVFSNFANVHSHFLKGAHRTLYGPHTHTYLYYIKAVDPSYFLVDYKDDFCVEEDLYMAIGLSYHGDIRSREANSSAQKLKTENLVRFVEWCPTGFKIGLNKLKQVPPSLTFVAPLHILAY